MIAQRHCSKPGCSTVAVATLTYDYRDSTVVVGPLATVADPNSYDLCDEHAQNLKAPLGWQVVRLATTFERMGDLARHIAESARRTYPNSPVPQNLVPTFAKMQQFLDITGGRLVDMLADRDTAIAEQIIRDDDQLDDLHLKIMQYADSAEWEGTNEQLINVVLIARFMERLGDHAVSAARRVVFIVSGFDPTKTPSRDEGTDID